MFAFKFTILSFLHSSTIPQDVRYRYYNEKNYNPNYSLKRNDAVLTEVDKIFVFECLFESIDYGAIRIEEVTPKFLHSSCFFDSCTTSN